MVALILSLVLQSSVTHAENPHIVWPGPYVCSVNGQDRTVAVEYQNDEVKILGLDLGFNDPLPCVNQKLSQQRDGATYTFVSACSQNEGIYRALILDRPDSLERFSVTTHIRPLSATQLNIHVKIKFTGTPDQDFVVDCRK